MNFIDNFLNKITMYRLVMYFLMLIILVALILSFFHILAYRPWAILASFAFLTFVCWASNEIFAWAFKVPANVESSYITAFILVLILTTSFLLLYFGFFARFSLGTYKFIPYSYSTAMSHPSSYLLGQMGLFKTSRSVCACVCVTAEKVDVVFAESA